METPEVENSADPEPSEPLSPLLRHDADESYNADARADVYITDLEESTPDHFIGSISFAGIHHHAELARIVRLTDGWRCADDVPRGLCNAIYALCSPTRNEPPQTVRIQGHHGDFALIISPSLR